MPNLAPGNSTYNGSCHIRPGIVDSRWCSPSLLPSSAQGTDTGSAVRLAFAVAADRQTRAAASWGAHPIVPGRHGGMRRRRSKDARHSRPSYGTVDSRRSTRRSEISDHPGPCILGGRSFKCDSQESRPAGKDHAILVIGRAGAERGSTLSADTLAGQQLRAPTAAPRGEPGSAHLAQAETGLECALASGRGSFRRHFVYRGGRTNGPETASALQNAGEKVTSRTTGRTRHGCDEKVQNAELRPMLGSAKLSVSGRNSAELHNRAHVYIHILPYCRTRTFHGRTELPPRRRRGHARCW